jgi:hypothetical protein
VNEDDRLTFLLSFNGFTDGIMKLLIERLDELELPVLIDDRPSCGRFMRVFS